MLTLDQDKFITDFVITFLATDAAKMYAKAGDEPFAMHQPPIADALMAARLTWMHLLQMGYLQQHRVPNPLFAAKLDPEQSTEDDLKDDTLRSDHGAPNE